MAPRRYPTPEEILAGEFIEEDCIVDMNGELESTLEDLEKVEYKNKNLEENIKEVDECIKKLREKTRNSKKDISK